MPFPKVSPYDILEISPSANLKEIMSAYQKALKKGRYPQNKVAQAFNELRNTRKRAEHDLLQYDHLGEMDEIQELMASLPPASFLPTEMKQVDKPVSPLPLSNALIMAPSLADMAADFEQIPDCPLQLQSSNRYENLMAVLPAIPFPA